MYLAQLAVRTAHDLAGIQASSLAIDVNLANKSGWTITCCRGATNLLGASSDEVVGVAREAFIANTRHVMVVCHTESIGSAIGTTTSIHALPPHRVGQDGTDLIVTAIRIVGTLGNGWTADSTVVRITTLKSRSTQTLSNITDRIGPTFLVATQVLAFSAVLDGTHLEGISDKAVLATAVVAAGDVDADSIVTTDSRRTLINVQTVAVSIAGVTLCTDALRSTCGHWAQGIGATLEGGTRRA
jgi:hypothetical protein